MIGCHRACTLQCTAEFGDPCRMCLELDMPVLMVGNPGRIEEGHVGSLIIFLPKNPWNAGWRCDLL